MQCDHGNYSAIETNRTLINTLFSSIESGKNCGCGLELPNYEDNQERYQNETHRDYWGEKAIKNDKDRHRMLLCSRRNLQFGVVFLFVMLLPRYSHAVIYAYQTFIFTKAKSR